MITEKELLRYGINELNPKGIFTKHTTSVDEYYMYQRKVKKNDIRIAKFIVKNDVITRIYGIADIITNTLISPIFIGAIETMDELPVILKCLEL